MPAPEKLIIDTPEQIALEFPLAGVGSRFLALAFDMVLQAGALMILGVMGVIARRAGAWAIGTAALSHWTIAILIAVVFLIYAGYFAIFESVWAGQTPGKRLVGLRVIDASGRPMTVYAAVIRNLLRLVDQLPGFYAIGILSVLVTRRQQRLGDLAAGTVVVHERIGGAAPPAQAPRRGVASRLGADRLTPGEIVVIEGFLRRRGDLDPWVRAQTARKIARRMADTLGIGAIEDEERLLEQLAEEYRSSDRYR